MRATKEERKERRERRKKEYDKYIKSSTWKSIRRKIIKRDKCCRACKSRSKLVVHHISYPKELGKEKLSWLMVLCEDCHNQVHALMRKGLRLRTATKKVLGEEVKWSEIKKAEKELSKNKLRIESLSSSGTPAGRWI